MKQVLMSVLRNQKTEVEHYRQAADQLGTLLAIEASKKLSTLSASIDTPLAKTEGIAFKQELILVPILRSGLVLLPPFLRFYPQATIGFIGTRRNETTAVAELYYSNLPSFTTECSIFLLDPMIATGGSATLAVKLLKKAGASESQITLVSFLAAPEGVTHFQKECPLASLIVAQTDERLDNQKRIIPGLGDFGDRYFGTNAT